MPDRSVERNLTGETVEEKDRARLQAVRSGLADLRREIHGLPSEQIVVEGESIEPVPLTPGSESDDNSIGKFRTIPTALTARDSFLGQQIHDSRKTKMAVRKAA